MWELIRANKKRSIFLVAIMALIMLILGALVGQAIGLYVHVGNFAGNTFERYTEAIDGKDVDLSDSFSLEAFFKSFIHNPSWMIGMGIAFIIWLIQALVAYYAGGKIMLAASGAKEVSHDVHPILFNVVDEMTIASGIGKRPKIYIIPTEVPNAFATGTKPDNAAVAVTAGLLGKLNRDELQGVMAHEIGHIANRDVMFMTMVSIMLGTIVLISEVFLRGIFFSSHSRYRGKRENNGGQAIIMIIAIIFAILAPIIAQLVYFAISRKREYLADATAVRYTRYPEGLASALEKISNNSGKIESANKITAPMYINNPLNKKCLSGLTSTHPPIENRIAILRKLSGDSGYKSYEKAFQSITHSSCIPASALADTETIATRSSQTSAKASSSDNIKAARSTGDMIMALNNFAFIKCACGVKLKIPPDFKKTQAKCPKCKTVHSIHQAKLAAAAAILASTNNNVIDIKKK